MLGGAFVDGRFESRGTVLQAVKTPEGDKEGTTRQVEYGHG
ncbi:DnaJ-class molecular chaperone [Halapricum desulfuricans]|uniref:DnaJ-class molecular chaperone n=1 Tax=Halapricum desulfuricans TaxID=2841257 RepID=A0A897NDP8_9EURY|nr:DnaJ-class molecular chaperone [Halapricum desulfuricans]